MCVCVICILVTCFKSLCFERFNKSFFSKKKMVYWCYPTGPKISTDTRSFYFIFDEKWIKSVLKSSNWKQCCLKIKNFMIRYGSLQLENTGLSSHCMLICTSSYLLEAGNVYIYQKRKYSGPSSSDLYFISACYGSTTIIFLAFCR